MVDEVAITIVLHLLTLSLWEGIRRGPEKSVEVFKIRIN